MLESNLTHHLSVIVPYRDREEHLNSFIISLEDFLNLNLKCSYDINIVEQNNSDLFNRGQLVNIGFDIKLKENKMTYICIHDVDTIPLEKTDSLLYDLPNCPTHLCYGRSTENFQLMYPNFFGGVNLFLKEDFIKINGFSNNYKGWGAEDDDLLNRCIAEKLNVHRRKGLFVQMPHAKSTMSNYHNNLHLLQENWLENNNQNYKKDGLNNLSYSLIFSKKLSNATTKYSVNF